MATISGNIRVELLSHTPLAVCGRLANTERGANYLDNEQAINVALELAKKRELDVFRFSMFIFDCVAPLYATLELNRCFTVNIQQPLDASSLAFYGCDKVELDDLCCYLTAASKIIEKNNARELLPCNFLVRNSYALSLLDLLNSRERLEKGKVTRIVFDEMVGKLIRTEWCEVINLLMKEG